MMKNDDTLREQLLVLLEGKGAHASFDQAVEDFPRDSIGVRPDGFAHSAWQLVEHIRIALWDLVEYSRKEDHISPEWPSEYWPEDESPPSPSAWGESLEAYRHWLAEMKGLVADPAVDLTAPLRWNESASLLREVLLAADHSAYHVGQIIDLRRALGCWPAAGAS
ncbi:MAG TPA: DinB family protein [Thermoanaerobaculia bacterium]|nr:DinB family protein [Thermoanaerobaculia bacterium]